MTKYRRLYLWEQTSEENKYFEADIRLEQLAGSASWSGTGGFVVYTGKQPRITSGCQFSLELH